MRQQLDGLKAVTEEKEPRFFGQLLHHRATSGVKHIEYFRFEQEDRATCFLKQESKDRKV